MKNLVIKTIVITLAAIVSLLAITFGTLTVFTPKTLGGVFDGAGNYSAAVFFYDLQYEKTGDIEDLAVLVDETYGFGDKENAKKYIAVMLKHKDFETYGSRKTQTGITLKDYYLGLNEILNGTAD
ncbi:MAG: hypothetical protein IJV95_01235 [Clostridia bacterium]|nr:hypothetical protein [Clostridia bacterium]